MLHRFDFTFERDELTYKYDLTLNLSENRATACDGEASLPPCKFTHAAGLAPGRGGELDRWHLPHLMQA